MGFLGQAKLDLRGECFQTLDLVGHAGCVAGLEPRTSPPMSKRKPHKNRVRYSRTNGKAPSQHREATLLLDGSTFLSDIPTHLESVDHVELVCPRVNEFTLLSGIVATALALSEISSPFDAVRTSWDSQADFEDVPELTVQHDYLLPGGFAHTTFFPDRSLLQVLTGAEDLLSARRVASRSMERIKNFGLDDERHHLPVLWERRDLEESLIVAVLMYGRFDGASDVHPSELVSLFDWQRRSDPLAPLDELVGRALGVHRRINRRQLGPS